MISETTLPSRVVVQSAVEYETIHHISGIQFIYLGTQTVTQSTVTQTISLKTFGIKLYLSPNTFSEPVFSITIGVGLSGSFISPERMTLVSAVYYIRTSSELLRPITVEIEHCVILLDNNKTSGLKFGKADTNSYWASPPYIFKTLSEGMFPVGQSWGTIQMSSFSLLSIFWYDDNPPVEYLAGVLSYPHKHGSGKLGRYKVLFLAGRNLGVNKEV